MRNPKTGQVQNPPIMSLVRALDQIHNNLALSETWPCSLQKMTEKLSITSLSKRHPLYRPRLLTLIANIAVRNQVMFLTLPGLEEETHTNAFFGILASYIPVVNAMSYGTRLAVGNRADQGLYWVHQQKQTEEPRTGADFGIMTDIDNETVKLTLFQAKRPKTAEAFEEITATHTVRKGNIATPEDLKYRPQTDELDAIFDKVRLGSPLKDILNPAAGFNLDRALDDGVNSLFRSKLPYKQSLAFLATALRGARGGTGSADGWCHYVQWPYGKRQNPWTLTVTEVLQHGGARHGDPNEKRFSNILARALSSYDSTIGIRVKKKDISNMASTISSLLPDLLWGCTSSSEEGALQLGSIVNKGREAAGFSPRKLVHSYAQSQASRTDQHTKETDEPGFQM